LHRIAAADRVNDGRHVYQSRPKSVGNYGIEFWLISRVQCFLKSSQPGTEMRSSYRAHLIQTLNKLRQRENSIVGSFKHEPLSIFQTWYSR
jgi:hypothetical protein